MIWLIQDLLLALAAFAVTAICGLPLAWNTGQRLMTRISMSFAAGFVLLSAAGVVGAISGVGVLVAQAAALASAVLSAFFLLLRRPAPSAGPDRDDWLAMGIGALYLVIGIYFFDRIVMWMAGDALAHAGMVRMLLDGQALPVGLPRLGSYWEYYPKGFHYYSYPFASASSVLDAIQTIPVLITSVTPLLLYSTVREIGEQREAVYALLLSCLLFPAHYSYLIWGGYPSAAAEMLLVAAVLAAAVRRRLLPLLLLGVLLAHGRLLALALGLLLCWTAAERPDRRQGAAIASVTAAALALVAATQHVHMPDCLLSALSDRSLAVELVARWYPSILALLGGAIAAVRLQRIDRLALAWTAGVIAIVILADTGPLGFVGTADRLMLGLYLPLSLLSGAALSRMEGSDGRIGRMFLLLLTLVGAASMGVVLYSYAGSWGLPAEDYEAIIWLKDLNLSDAVCINLDETGAWVYPVAGIRASMPRGIPTGFAYGLPGSIALDPGDPAVLEELEGLGHGNVLIYISSVSIARPGHIPPFAEYSSVYPAVNLSYPQGSYELLYDRGARIYRFQAGP